MKILQIDRNGYYGSESASLNLTNMWSKFRDDQKVPSKYGENRDWNVDLIPKFILANGSLVKLLLQTTVSQYLEWKPIDGIFVYQWDKGGMFSSAKGKIKKVPSNDSEALSSDLMGMFEKNRCRKFFQFIQAYDVNDKKSQKGLSPEVPFNKVVEEYGLETNTIDFIGHAVALYTNDDFLEKPSGKTIDKIKLYSSSVGLYGDSAFLYPVWGLSGLSESFSRMCALHGGTYMLNTECEKVHFNEDGTFEGISNKDGKAYAKILISEPSYVLPYEKVKSMGKVIRLICILDHPIPKTNEVPSCQIILPQRQIGRKNGRLISRHFHRKR